jgi:DNA-binding MarR family transcriptional regulator
MSPCTPKQKVVEDFVRRFTEDHRGVAPTIREIAKAIRTTPSSVQAIVRRLEARGRLRRLPGQPRTLEIIA